MRILDFDRFLFNQLANTRNYYSQLEIRLAQMEASQQPPEAGDTRNTTPGLIGVSILFVISLTIYGVRMYTRIRPTIKLTAGDYVVTAALVGSQSGRTRIMLTFNDRCAS